MTRFIKHNTESDYQNIQAEYTRRLAKIEEELANLKNILQELTKKRERELIKNIRIIKETEIKTYH